MKVQDGKDNTGYFGFLALLNLRGILLIIWPYNFRLSTYLKEEKFTLKLH